MQQFFKSYKDSSDMGRLEIVMRLEIFFFLVVFIIYIFMGLVLEVVKTLSCRVVTKDQKSLKQICCEKMQICLRMFNLLLSFGM